MQTTQLLVISSQFKANFPLPNVEQLISEILKSSQAMRKSTEVPSLLLVLINPSLQSLMFLILQMALAMEFWSQQTAYSLESPPTTLLPHPLASAKSSTASREFLFKNTLELLKAKLNKVYWLRFCNLNIPASSIDLQKA